ncbi:MAG: carbohydrate ABC transporter substrate-binding protein [Methanobacteriota archaeon]|nr:MAG: carbohydrate ABC transporter substrate-binding protein [Euryarchaeota archaeon]
MAAPGTPASEAGRASENYRPPSARGRLIAIIAALLIITNVITGLSAFYLAQPTVSAAALCPGTSGASKAPAVTYSSSSLGTDSSSTPTTFRIDPPVNPTATTVTIVGPWAVDSEAKPFLRVLENFTRITGTTVIYKQIRQEELTTILPTQFAAGRAPGDVIFMVSSFIKANGPNHMLKLNGGNITDAKYTPGSLDPVKVGADDYGGVYTGKVKPGFWYRKSFFAAHNLTVPTSFQEFKDLLVKISKISGIRTPIVSGDGVGWPLSDITEHFIATYGGAAMHRALTNKTMAWTSPEVRAIFADRLVPLLAGKCFSEPLEWNTVALTNWWGGLHALFFMGSWITGLVPPGVTPVNATDLGVFSLPPVTGTARGIVFAGDYFFIPKYTANTTGAMQLAQWLAGKEGQDYQVKQGGHIATALGVPLADYPPVDRGVEQLMNGVEILSDLDDTIGGQFQTNFWSQLQLLWVSPNQLDSVLASIQAKVSA